MKIFLTLCLFLCSSLSLNAFSLPVREIRYEEIWKGKVFITGIVAVKKNGKLTIEPGTEVIFKSIDIDDDGIGDSELYVEGTLIVKGTKYMPVIFTSDSQEKSPSSWKYVMVNHANYAYIDYAIFEGAFSGLQVHFTKAVVKNSVFRNNIDGFRFSTSNIYVCNNKMT